MRQYECTCLTCGIKKQILFKSEPYPQYGESFSHYCTACETDTIHTRVLTKRTAAELRAAEREQALRQSIAEQCAELGFQHRFLYQSVIITTPLSDWCFDYHQSRITLYHESTIKINFATGDYAKAHTQFQNRKMTPSEVIAYIAAHDAWRAVKKTNISLDSDVTS